MVKITMPRAFRRARRAGSRRRSPYGPPWSAVAGPRWAAAVMAGLAAAAMLPGPGRIAGNAPGSPGPAAAGAGAATRLVRISSDPMSNAGSQHATEDDPSTYARGSTVVSVFTQGLFANGSGAAGIGFAASVNGGRTWTHGSVPGITVFQGGRYSRVVFPTVAYDPRQRTWLVAMLAGQINPANPDGPPISMAVLVSRSADNGRTWRAPVTVAAESDGRNLDGPAITCDVSAASRYYGRCYVEFTRLDRPGDSAGKVILMSASATGGESWGPAKGTANHATGTAGRPLVQPDGTVVVPIDKWPHPTAVLSFASDNGGKSWGPAHVAVRVKFAADPLGQGGIPLLSAAMDAAGRIYLAWQDCRFHPRCAANDVVTASSPDGVTWSRVRRVTRGPGDHTLPGMGIDPLSAGGSARIGITYYRYPDPRCKVAYCPIDVRFTSSADGGRSWAIPVRVAVPMRASWLAKTPFGAVVSDFISAAALPGGNVVTAFPLAAPPSGSMLHQDTYAVRGGMPIAGPRCGRGRCRTPR